MSNTTIALLVGTLLLGGAGGCTDKRPRCTTYHFHKSFPVQYQAAARQAAANWSAFSGIDVKVEDGDPEDRTCSIGNVDDTSADYAELETEMGGASFWGAHRYTDGSIVLVNDAWRGNDYAMDDLGKFATFIMMHEIAHEFGLQHIADPNAVMGVTLPWARLAYDDADRAECVRAGACK